MHEPAGCTFQRLKGGQCRLKAVLGHDRLYTLLSQALAAEEEENARSSVGRSVSHLPDGPVPIHTR